MTPEVGGFDSNLSLSPESLVLPWSFWIYCLCFVSMLHFFLMTTWLDVSHLPILSRAMWENSLIRNTPVICLPLWSTLHWSQFVNVSFVFRFDHTCLTNSLINGKLHKDRNGLTFPREMPMSSFELGHIVVVKTTYGCLLERTYLTCDEMAAGKDEEIFLKGWIWCRGRARTYFACVKTWTVSATLPVSISRSVTSWSQTTKHCFVWPHNSSGNNKQ